MAMNPVEAVTPEKQYSRTETNVCRLCGEGKDYKKSINIFGKVGQEKKIAECIERTLNIIIDETECDSLACKIFRKCQDLLKKIDDFKTILALKTQEILKSRNFTKRCSKSPLVSEPGKRGRKEADDVSNSQTYSSSKRLEFNSPDDTSSQNKELSPEGEGLAAFGLNDKPVCTFKNFILCENNI